MSVSESEKVISEIVKFICDQMTKAGFKNLIVGLSGGLDSAVTAALSVKAVGRDNVFGVMMPHRKSHLDSLSHAKLIAEQLGIKYQIVDISPMVDSYFTNYEPEADILRRGNRMARERMCVLYDLSAKHKALVVGTGNKSELLVGYCTQYGDSACAFEPIGHLYKTEVKQIARILQIPDIIINKNPTADLWESQTDEAEMGISYTKLDKILYNMIELKKGLEELKKIGFSESELIKVKNMIERSEFKRNMPPVMD
jgi:NAD+ synthase